MAEDDFDLEKSAQRITKGALRGLWDWLLGRSDGSESGPTPGRSILILGSNGTGKTTLARFLSGQLDWFDNEPDGYQESLGVERFALADDPGVELVVPPGQDFRRPSTWPELKARLAGGAFRGVVLVNAFGYHNFSTRSYTHHQLYAGSKAEFWDRYRADRRAEEVRILRELAPHLATSAQKLWLLSVVTKQDLWAGQQAAAEAHYLRGDYAAALDPVAGAVGGRNFRHELVWASLVLRNLRTRDREPLADTEAGYDISRQAEALRGLYAALSELRRWEGEQ
ncbi:MAG: hypothetical protein K2V38_22895 [Gemmataceae bacterium]|nr:hypothetical protein [Gemmataceae bacterium]